MAKRSAQGAGTIRKKTVIRNGKEYTYWEARITIGRDPGTGKQIQKSFSGKTQKEVRQKLQAAAVSVDAGTYVAPAKLTVAEWLDIWTDQYLIDRKTATVVTYKGLIKNHIAPALGATKLKKLSPHQVQTFVNGLEDLSASSVRLIYKTLHASLEKAVRLEYIPRNPSDYCTLPKAEQKEIHPLHDLQTAALLQAAKGTELEIMVTVALLTGMRQSELLGLTWDCIDQEKGSVAITKQLSAQQHRSKGLFISPKNGKPRTIHPALSVMQALKAQKIKQAEMRFKAGSIWNNEHNLVFTMNDGSIYDQWRLRLEFSKLTETANLENVRFHDLRHTYAVNAIRAGDDIKTIQGNLGHASAAFTLDRYGHFTEQMKQDSANRMENFIKGVWNL